MNIGLNGFDHAKEIKHAVLLTQKQIGFCIWKTLTNMSNCIYYIKISWFFWFCSDIYTCSIELSVDEVACVKTNTGVYI